MKIYGNINFVTQVYLKLSVVYKCFFPYNIAVSMIPLACIERLARKAGASRISAKAIKELSKTVEEIGLELSVEAAQVAKHAKRKTILKEDIKLIAGKA